MEDYNTLPIEIRELLDSAPTVDEVLPKLKEKAKKITASPKFYAEFLKADFANEIETAMVKLRLNKKTLAEKLGFSRQYIGRVLNENANFTIETMAAFAIALNMKLIIKMTEKNIQPVNVEKKQVFNSAMDFDKTQPIFRQSLTTSTVINFGDYSGTSGEIEKKPLAIAEAY